MWSSLITRLKDALRYDWRLSPRDCAVAAGIVLLITLGGLPFQSHAGNLTMIYLTGVVIAAAWRGVAPAILAAVLSVSAFNFVFVPPYYSFRSYDAGQYMTFAVMLVTALVVGSLTARVSQHARLARQREAEARRLYDLTRKLSSLGSAEDMLSAAISEIGPAYGVTVRVFLATDAPDESDRLAVEWVRNHGRAAGHDAGIMASAAALYLPLASDGVLCLTPGEGRRFTPGEILQFETFAALIAQALHRARQAAEAEGERLRNVLLSSLSHDLRTPLTGMTGSLSAVLKMRRKLPREAVEELTALWGQLERLHSFVNNLLRLAALTSGRMAFTFEPYLIQEIIGAALARPTLQSSGRRLRTVMTGALPLVRIDGALVEQVLVNLLENAVQHTGEAGVIIVAAERDGAWLRATVSDDGPGLPDDADGLFDAFHSDRQGGTGLGLAICRGIIAAHGGEISAHNLAKGAAFTFTLPVAELT